MKMYLYRERDANELALVIHFGLGLIGKAIYESLRIHGDLIFDLDMTTPWNDLQVLKRKLKDDMLKQLEIIEAGRGSVSPSRVITIWSAGTIGMLSDDVEVNRNLLVFKFCVEVVSVIQQKYRKADTTLLFMSSAGGLFEGQSNASAISGEKPLGLYGQMKVEQEKFLRNHEGFRRIVTYRISSVYSVHNFGSRQGIINVLLHNTVKNKSTTIFGGVNTIRDYVLDTDIGKYIAKHVFNDEGESTRYIISTKPTSTFELKTIVEQITGRRVYLSYQSGLNDSMISFAPNLRASGFLSSDLRCNLFHLYRNLLSSLNET